ncbi:MAG TPA: hypothetical protein VMZ00_18355 [Sporichthya sp.]|nr:hypothetical protein [Sporichthya sp.]
MRPVSPRSAALLAPLVLLSGLAAAGPAAAKGGGDVVRASGNCSGSADWKLKAKHDDGRIEVELEVDSNRAGQRWSWKLTDNGTKVASGQKTTAGRSGSFSIERRIGDRSGTDTIRLRAVRGSQVCVGSLKI